VRVLVLALALALAAFTAAPRPDSPPNHNLPRAARDVVVTAGDHLGAPAHPVPAVAAASRGIGSCRLARRYYRTLPGIRTPAFCMIRRPASGTAPGLLMMTPRPGGRRAPGGGQFAAMILTNAGRLVWYSRRRQRVHTMQTVRYRGRTLLAIYQRQHFGGYFELRDRRYREVMRLRMGGGYPTDMHEMQVTPQGTVYLDSYHRVSVPGVGRVTDWVMREIDMATGKVLFEWHALRHVPLRATFAPQPPRGPRRSWDFFHGNSIEPPAPGGRTIIVSSRNTSAVYGIDRETGAVRWILGGKRDQFGLRRHPSWRFCAQHDVRRLPDGDITLFDNGGAGRRFGTGCGVHAARVPRFRLDVTRHTVRLVDVIPSAPSSPDGRGLFPSATGNAQRQPNGDTLISWGTTGFVTQVTQADRIRAAMRVEPWTYRVLRASWLGYPPGRPKVVAERGSRRLVDVWASWNGATQIHGWRVLTGNSPTRLRLVSRRYPIRDLETRMRVRTVARYVEVRAVSARNRTLGTSRVTRVRPSRASGG
jgi:Arylsulfotransferase (ASST)